MLRFFARLLGIASVRPPADYAAADRPAGCDYCAGGGGRSGYPAHGAAPGGRGGDNFRADAPGVGVTWCPICGAGGPEGEG